jgi:DNA-binding PadR family transcriptional regulator
MYPSILWPEPLTPNTFYVLLALASRGEMHGYPLRGAATNDSFGSIIIKDGALYPLLKRMISQGLIEEAGTKPGGKKNQDRLHYRITPDGLDRLKQDLKRLKYALTVGESAGLLNDEIPQDIQKLLRDLA